MTKLLNTLLLTAIIAFSSACSRDIEADAILVSFGVQPQAYFDIISGAFEPSGLLPVQFPADMQTVEQQFEDTPRDMKCHQDTDGNIYDFAFGLNWSGVIDDERVQKYR